MLVELGISPETERVYLAMLKFPDYDLARLSRALDLTRQQVRSAVDQLASARLVAVAKDDPDAWRLLDPNTGIMTLLQSQQDDLRVRQERLEGARVAVTNALAKLNVGDSPKIGVEKLRSAEAVRARLSELAERCTTEVWSLNPNGAQTEAGIAAAQPLAEATLARGIEMRGVYLTSACNDEPTRRHLKWISEQGAHVRVTPSLPTRMIIIDRSVVVLPIDIEDSSQGALVVTEQGLVTNSITLYLTVWKSARPLGSQSRHTPNGLTEQEHHAVQLWATGHKDSAVARKLGVSERTVRRINDSVAEKLGARSRFQTGACAVSQGIIDSSDLM